MNRHHLRITALLAAALLNAPAFASDDEDLPFKNLQALDYTSSLEIGAGYISEDSIVYGGYNGEDARGARAIADLSVLRRDPYDGTSNRYWSFTTQDIGTDARLLRGEYGAQGNYRAWFSYRELPRIEWLAESARTPLVSLSKYVLDLPAAWAQTPYAASVLRDADLAYERENFELGFTWDFDPHWTLNALYTRDDKTGHKSLGTYAPLILVEEPLDFRDQTVQVSLAYHAPHYQSELSYEHSRFENASLGLVVDSIQLDLPPDNTWQQIGWNGAFHLGQRSRLTLAVSRGVREQDADFLPFSINPAQNRPLPRDSLDGELTVTHYNAQLTTRLMRGLTVKASFDQDERDNDTPTTTYFYIMVDLLPREERINWPYEFKTSKWALKANYDLGRWADLSVGIDSKEHRRSPFSEVRESQEDTVWAKLKWTPSARFNASVKVEDQERDGTPYDFDSQFYASRPAGTTRLPTQHPALRQYHKTDRERDRVVVSAGITPLENLGINLSWDLARDSYQDARYGLSDRDVSNFNLDLQYQPVPNLELHAYMGQMEVLSDQASSGDGGWALEIDDDSELYGFGANWEVLRNKLDVELDYSYHKGDEDFNFAPPAVVGVPPSGVGVFLDLPYGQERKDLRLTATLHILVDLALKLEYEYLSFNSEDYALDGLGVEANRVRGDIIFGSTSPDDNLHGVQLTIVKRF